MYFMEAILFGKEMELTIKYSFQSKMVRGRMMSNKLLLTKLRKLLKSDLDLQAPCQNVNYKQASVREGTSGTSTMSAPKML